MTACTQPGCTGSIVDGYCDVCGSPAGAVPFVIAEAAASASSPVPAVEPGLTAVGRGAGVPLEPKNEGPNTACTQPGCTGSIVDGYCDLCGSPAGAVPFVPAEAAASRASATLSDEPGLTAVGLGSGVSSVPKSEDLDTACTQPECTGRIVDGYCDVCGSPAVVVPFVPAEAAASTESSAPADEPALAAGPVLRPASASVDEEISTQPIPREKIPRQRLSTQGRADPGAADPAEPVDAQKVDGEKVDPAAGDTGQVVGHKELTEDELDGAQNYRTRVEEAQLPDDVREAALREVGKLERTSDESPESDDIRTWLDTMLDLPWSTKTAGWIDVQESREVEATLRRLIEPGVVDMEEADTASTQEVADPEPADAGAVEEESPTQPIPRLKMPSQPSSTQELVDSVASDPSPVDAQKVDEEKVDPAAGDTGQVVGHKELTEDELDGAQNYRTRVEEAQLPDDVREAALREVAKLERTSDQSPESDDIRNWLDTMLDLPWSTKTAGWIDVQESREVEATLRGLIKPAVADVEEGDTAEVEPVVADLEEGDTAKVDLEEGDTAKVDPAEVDTVNIDRKKKLAGNETNGSQDLETRVEEAQLPDEVRLAALREVGMLERTSDQSPESDDIRNGLDTMLDLPWSTEISDSIDIEGSRDVEATLRGLIKPAVADVDESRTGEVEPLVTDLEEGDSAEVEPVATDLEEGDSAEVEPVATDLEEGDTAKVDPVAADSGNAESPPAGPHDDDTVQMPAVLAGLSGRAHPPLQLPEQQVVGPVLVETPPEKRRFRSLALAATAALVLLLIGALVFGASRDSSVTAQSAPTVTATATATVSEPTSEPSDKSTRTGAASAIQVQEVSEPATRFPDRSHQG